MTRSIKFAPEEFYHLYNRGTEKRKIFMRHGDYARFLALLYFANQAGPVDLKRQGSTLSEVKEPREDEPLVDIGSYCLMPNHFHLLVRERQENGISVFAQKVLTGYTMYFNKRYERTGALFQSKFKATHVDEDRYLNYLIAYIHLNPVKLIEPGWKESGIANRKRAEKYLEGYRYSSYLDYLHPQKSRPEQVIIERDCLPDYFASEADFQRHITEWLTYKPE